VSVIVLIETAGTQRYLFATSKRRETVGASGLVARLPDWGAEWETQYGEYTRLQSISGKLLVAVDDVTLARSLITHVTTRAAQEADGLDVAGCFVSCEPLNPSSVHSAIQRVHRIVGQARSLRPSPLQRHRMFPGLEPCEASGLPASQTVRVGGEEQARRSLASQQKLQAADKRLDALAITLNTHRQVLLESLHALDGDPADEATGASNESIDLQSEEPDAVQNKKELQRIATIHIDVNGLGVLMAELLKRRTETMVDLSSIAALYRELSEEVEKAMRTAVAKGCHDAIAQGVPLLPIVIGGDDVTIVCKASIAHQVTRNILLEFEAAIVKSFGRLSAAAGICYSRRQFPFTVAHEIASELCASSKQIKTVLAVGDSFAHTSAFDAHVVLDSSPSSLAAIRATGTFGNHRSWSGPYVVSGPSNSDRELLGASQLQWVDLHDESHLNSRIAAVNAKSTKGERLIPRGQLQALRSEIVSNAVNADIELAQLMEKNKNLRAFVETDVQDRASLWFQEPNATGLNYKTRLIDALIHADIRQESTQ
jgi:hypothetical protein